MDTFRDRPDKTALAPDAQAELSGVVPRCELNGVPADAEALRTPALLNYGHFTAMQVQGGCVRGLDLHLQRLDRATRELFGHPLDAATVQRYMQTIVGAERAPLSLRVNVFSRHLQRDRPAEPAQPDVLTSISAARVVDATPVRLKTFRYQRVLPHIKHVGTFEVFHHKRLAQLDGYDDALFVDASGAVSEASIWNIGFFDGERVVWPDAPILAGIAMQLLQKGLRESGIETTTQHVALADIAAFRSAFLTNSSCAVLPIESIDGVRFAIDADLVLMLEASYARNPWQPL